MSAVILGASSKLSVGLASADTEITGVATGTDAMVLGIRPDVAQIPAGFGVAAARVGLFKTYDFGFVTDVNAVTAPLLRAANGHRIRFEFFAGVTGRTYTGSGIATVRKQWLRTANRKVWQVQIAVDGAPTVA